MDFFLPQRSPLPLGSIVLIQISNYNSTTATSTGQTALGIWEYILPRNMHSHVEYTLNSVSRYLNTVKVMSSLSGVNSMFLLRTFNACTRACLDYGSECFNLFSLTQTRQLQRKQNTGLKFVLGVNKWAPTSSIHTELQILPMAYRVEVFQANMIKKFLLNINHPLQEYLSAELVAPQPQNTRLKQKWLSTICRAHRKLSPYIPATEIVPLLQPWSHLPLQIITNDHLPSKQNTDPMILYDLTMVEMANIIQPRDNIFFTDSTVAG